MSDAQTEFLQHAAMTRDYASMNLSEADTRVYLIDPVLTILGYRAVTDIRREVPVAATREFVDYELSAGGQAQAIVEAKAVRHPITDQHAGQCVQYASVLGVRWCLITNGVAWTVYDAHARGPLAAKRVSEVRLDGDAQSAARAWSVLSLFSRDSLSKSPPLTALLIARVVADELSRADSPAVAALRRVVKERFGESVSAQSIVDAVANASQPVSAVTSSSDDSPVTEPSAPRVPKARRGSRLPLGELIDGGLLPPDAILECKLHRRAHTARVRDGAIDIDGKTYATPSAAATVLRGGKASNGWVIWHYKGESLAEIRARLVARRSQLDPN